MFFLRFKSFFFYLNKNNMETKKKLVKKNYKVTLKNGKTASSAKISVNKSKPLYKTLKKQNKPFKLYGGCDLPLVPNLDGVYEHWNGIKSGKIYNLLQFYKFIEYWDCYRLKRFGNNLKLNYKRSKKFKFLPIAERMLNDIFVGYVLYDVTGLQIKKRSPSFLIGNVAIDKERQAIIFEQSPDDMMEPPPGHYVIHFRDELYIEMVKENKEIFFYEKEDGAFRPRKRSSKMALLKDALRQNRKTMEEKHKTPTQDMLKKINAAAVAKKQGIEVELNI
jgi:hypothetical protein